MNKQRQIKKLAKKEARLLHKKPISAPIQNRIKERVPEKAMITLEKAFEASFSVIFQKGSKWIEKAVKIKDKQEMGAFLKQEFQQVESRAHLKAFDKQIRSTKWKHLSLSTAKGAVLGLFGIGIPDIPIVLASLLSSIYSIGAAYGYDVRKDEEKAYVLLLLCASCDEEVQKEKWLVELDRWEAGIAAYQIPQLISDASHAMAYRELQAKFLQGIPVIGIAGSFMSNALQSNILAFANVRYKKRVLQQRSTSHFDNSNRNL